MAQSSLRVPGVTDHHPDAAGGLQPQRQSPTTNGAPARKSSLVTVKTGQRKTSFVSFDENRTTIEIEETEVEKDAKENGDNVEDTQKCEDEGNQRVSANILSSKCLIGD